MFPTKIRGLYRENDMFKPVLCESRTRVAQSKKRKLELLETPETSEISETPETSETQESPETPEIQETPEIPYIDLTVDSEELQYSGESQYSDESEEYKPIKKIKPTYDSSTVSVDSFKQKQRIRCLELIKNTTNMVIIIDSPVFDVYRMIIESAKTNDNLFKPKIVCINGDHDITTTIADKYNEEHYNVYRYSSDLYQYIATVNETIGLLWIDSMSGYTSSYRSIYRSTKDIVSLLCRKNLIENTILMWNANHARWNVYRDSREEKHAIQLLSDLSKQYTTSVVGDQSDGVYTDSNLNQVYLYGYVDKHQKMIYHELRIKKIDDMF